jgi:uncharacterized protein
LIAKVTLLYGGLCALLVTLLGTNVSLNRLFRKIWAGHELPKPMLMKVRAHGNAAEWIPLGIVLLFLLEASGVPTFWLHVLGGAFLTGRVLHAVGFLTPLPLSVTGATINYTVLSVMSGWAVYLHFMR